MKHSWERGVNIPAWVEYLHSYVPEFSDPGRVLGRGRGGPDELEGLTNDDATSSSDTCTDFYTSEFESFSSSEESEDDIIWEFISIPSTPSLAWSSMSLAWTKSRKLLPLRPH
jgi:hypothetical protein